MIISKLVENIKNIPGWRTKRKLLVIESDDWGSTRMPNKRAYQKLISEGIQVDKNNFTKFDSIASEKDLESLYTVLNSVRDVNNSPAIFTPFVNVTNPNFEKIKESGYQEYFFETFDQTLKRERSEGLLHLWKEGIGFGIFKPQYHGKEHYNVPLLMNFLRDDSYSIRKAFDHGVVHVPISEGVFNQIGGLAPTYFYRNKEELILHKNSLLDGLTIFKKSLVMTLQFLSPLMEFLIMNLKAFSKKHQSKL
jgi:hypothetical protein